MLKQFGGKINKELIEKFSHSKNWNGKIFLNTEETGINISLRNVPNLLKKQLFERKKREPETNIPFTPFNRDLWEKDAESARLVWFGHSAVLLRMGNKNILIDPMLGPDASPIAPFSTRRYTEGIIEIIKDLPRIDFLLLTHDHYDHLDYLSIRKLIAKTDRYLVPLGNARHLVSWGVKPELISEFDWHEKHSAGDLEFRFTPSRHFSGRGINDRNKSLWGGWIIRSGKENIYFSGDGGYGRHFKEIGEKYGPFDFAFMECGQYNENWHQIHMYPEESVQAGIDAQAKIIMPVHWGAFSLSLHHWKEPVERFLKAAKEKAISLKTPGLGEITNILPQSTEKEWWQTFR
ncbi:MAG: MBL fold metallo-hydrolase [Bacteroidales bacterium]|nr:MBL fold metallo-hydrolase [Bacteroidales bacterium]